MKKFPESRKLLESRMREVEKRIERTRRQLYWRVNFAKAPLEVWEKHNGVSNLQGGMLIFTPRRDYYQLLHKTVQAENYNDDWAESGREAITYLRLAKYELIVVDATSRNWWVWRLIRRVRQQYPHIEMVLIVDSEEQGKQAMRRGAFSYLRLPLDEEQFRLCLLSALRSRYRVCQVLKHRERCDKSCKNNFMFSDERGYIPGEMDIGY